MAKSDIVIKIVADAKKAKKEIEGLGGSFGGLSKGMVGMAAGSAAVGAALVAVGTKAIGAFKDLGIQVGKFSDATGVSADEASRWIEVSDDLGVGADTVQTALGKMEKQLGADKNAFEKYGIQVKYASDGTIDANETFLNAIDVLNKIEDPAMRAATGAQIFGKGWQGMSEVIGRGAPQLRADLAAVSNAKVFDEKKVAQSKALRESFDTIKDAGEDLFLIIGEKLAPVVVRIAGYFKDAIPTIEDVAGTIGDTLSNALENLGPTIEAAIKLIAGLSKALQWILDESRQSGDSPELDAMIRLKAATIEMTDAAIAAGASQEEVDAKLKELNGDVEAGIVYWQGQAAVLIDVDGTNKELAPSTEDVAAATQLAAQAAEEATAALDALIKSEQQQIDVLNAQIDAQRSVADANYALLDAQDTWEAGLDGLNEKIAKAGGNSREVAAAYREQTTNAVKVADATLRIYDEQAKANGVTLTAADTQRILNTSMLTSAETAKGPLRDSILDYIATQNSIPPYTLTRIKAEIAKGDIAAAQVLLDGVSKPVTAAVKIDVLAADIANAEDVINGVTRDRTTKVNVVPNMWMPPEPKPVSYSSRAGAVASTPPPPPPPPPPLRKTSGRATGSSFTEAGTTLVGEQGPELVVMPRGARILTATQTEQETTKPAPVVIRRRATLEPTQPQQDQRPIVVQFVLNNKVVQEMQIAADRLRRGGR